MAHPIVVVGSGFAGTILARALHARGQSVLLVERDVHPRFALGESSTPLASVSLERLASTYGLPDLLALSAYGRWQREIPDVGHGLKRGFTFYGHRRGEPYKNSRRNEARLLVAASPDDEIADSHWVRADVDHHLIRLATEEGVEFLDDCRVDEAVAVPGGWRLSATRGGRSLSIEASFVVDASGGSTFLPALPSPRPLRTVNGSVRTGLVFGHFSAVGSFVEQNPDATFADAPYPEEHAAVHHLLEEGWMYVLPFDDGRMSAGFVVDHAHPDAAGLLAADPESAWRELLSRYPSVQRQFAAAQPIRAIGSIPRIQRHVDPAAGNRWARLPHAFHFSSPMFSTGIAWSLVGVERLARMLGRETAPDPRDLEQYRRLLETEADFLDELAAPAYRHRGSFEKFAAWTYTYFAAASYAEVRQRLCDPPGPEGWAGLGFLSACDPVLRASARAAARALEPRPEASSPSPLGFGGTIAGLLQERDVIGLGDPARQRLYPVDVALLLRNAERLGLEPSQMRERIHRLRGPG